jgi:hypothetical protein
MKWSFLLQHQRALLLDQRPYFFHELSQQPRKRHFQPNMVMRYIDRAAGHLTENAYAELQMIVGPDFFLDRKHLAKIRWYAGKAGSQAADRFFLR